MTANTTLASQGTTLTITVGSGSATPVNGFTDFSGLGSGTATIIDASDLSSAAKQKQIGLPDEGTAKISLNYIEADAGQVAMETARSGRSLAHFIITLTSGTKYAFDGYVQTFEKSVSVDKLVTISASVEITGAVTKTPAA
jgi:hypothetical protein